MKHCIAIVGPSASGKSSVGPLIAERLQFSLYDIDKIVSDEIGKNIDKIFAEEGTEFFQQNTFQILQDLFHKIKNENALFIIGASSIPHKQIQDLIRKNCSMVIGLYAEPETLLRRISSSLSENKHAAHPLLVFDDSFFFAKSLFEFREPFTYFADEIVDTSNLSIHEVCNQLESLFHNTKYNFNMADFDKFYNKDADASYYLKPSSVLRNHIHLVTGENLTALDLGCGDGRNTIFAAKNNFQVTCCDLSKVAIDKIKATAEKENLKITASVNDVNSLSFENGKFDLIIASTIFDHLERKDALNLISNSKKWLKKSGFIYVGVFTVEDPAYKVRHGLLQESEKGTVSETGEFIKTFFEMNELKELFSDYKIDFYFEGLKSDLTHGNPHSHGEARIFCQKVK